MVRFGKNSIREESSLFGPNMSDSIEVKECVRDLGIMVDDTMNYSYHITKTVTKANNKASWTLRTFKSRDVNFLRKL